MLRLVQTTTKTKMARKCRRLANTSQYGSPLKPQETQDYEHRFANALKN